MKKKWSNFGILLSM